MFHPQLFGVSQEWLAPYIWSRYFCDAYRFLLILGFAFGVRVDPLSCPDAYSFQGLFVDAAIWIHRKVIGPSEGSANRNLKIMGGRHSDEL